MQARLTYRWLYKQAAFLSREEAACYLRRLNELDDPVVYARSSARCPDCGIPRVFGECSQLCRCAECREEYDLVQYAFTA